MPLARKIILVFFILFLVPIFCSANELNVKDFGAVGDGTTDDTDAIQLCLATATGTVYFPTGTYLVSESIITGGKNIRGDGMAKSILLANSNDLNVLMPDQSTVSEMGIIGSGEEGAGSGIYLDAFGLCELRNVAVYSCATGIKIRNAWDVTILNCEIGHEGDRSNGINDVDINGSDPADKPGQIRIIATRMTSDSLSGVHLKLISAAPGAMIGCHISYGENDAVFIQNSYGWHFVDLSCEGLAYVFGGANSQATVIGLKASPGVSGIFNPVMSSNCNFIMITGYEISLYSGANYNVTLSAEDGYGKPFIVKRNWGNCGDEQIISVDNSGAPNYEQDYQWGGARAGSHTWYAGKTEAVNLGRTGTLNTRNIYPKTDDTYYLGKNASESPLAWKGLVLKDTTDGKYYRIQITNGAINAFDLSN